jgi:hypothetical protein
VGVCVCVGVEMCVTAGAYVNTTNHEKGEANVGLKRASNVGWLQEARQHIGEFPHQIAVSCSHYSSQARVCEYV